MTQLKKHFLKHWQDKKFATPPQKVLLAVSGGLDSMAMANLFLETGISFSVAHCNFGLREEDADLDEALVKDWCEAHNIVFFSTKFDTKAEALARKKSIQETARDLRYRWFYTLAAQHHFIAIATAHHADDNAETLLINLARGTGIAGLHGIPEQNGKLIRPLLFATRAELNDYVIDSKIAYREDASNAKDEYLRNAIRHRVLPVLNELMPNVVQRMLETSNRIGEVEEIYNKAIEKERKKLLQSRGKDFYIPIKLLRHRMPLATICYEILKPFGFVANQVPAVLSLLDAESGKLALSPTHRLIRNRDFLILTALQEPDADLILIHGFDKKVVTANGSLEFSVLNKPPEKLETERAIALINVDKLEQPIILRRWKNGDYFYPLGMNMKKKKLGRFLTDLKIPLHEKEQVWVLESNKRLVWVVGLRLDERFKIRDNTTQFLKVTFLR